MASVGAVVAVLLSGIPGQATSSGLAPGWYCGDITQVNVGGSRLLFQAWTGTKVKNGIPQNNPLPGHSFLMKPNSLTFFEHIGDPRYGDPIVSHEGVNNPRRTTVQDYLQLIEDTFSKTTPLRVRVEAGQPSYIDGTPLSLFHYKNRTLHGCIVGPAKV